MTTQPPTEDQDQPIPEVDILFLGSPGVGKATFLSVLRINPPKRGGAVLCRRLPHIRDGKLDLTTAAPRDRHDLPAPSSPSDPSGSPCVFDVSLFRRPYKFRIYTSTSTLFIDPFPPAPSFAIIAYSISSRPSLHNAQYYWRKQLSLHYHDVERDMPVMLLGLKRDERTDRKCEDDETTFESVMPQEGLQAAQEMRCDRYAECSALTGELMWEVLEDITKTAAKTTTEKGGLSDNNSCRVM